MTGGRMRLISTPSGKGVIMTRGRDPIPGHSVAQPIPCGVY